MDELWRQPGVLILIGGLGVAVYLVAMRAGRASSPPYQKRDSLLTPAEAEFYRVLQGAVEGDWPIFVMVRLVDVISVKPKAEPRQRWLGPIIAKHLDFVVCDPEQLEPVLAIELDDASHERPDRAQRDRVVDAALEAAGLPLLRVKVASHYDQANLRQEIRTLLSD
jgi:very-short-patch-repair endonuclease